MARFNNKVNCLRVTICSRLERKLLAYTVDSWTLHGLSANSTCSQKFVTLQSSFHIHTCSHRFNQLWIISCVVCIYWKEYMYKWIHEVQIHFVQGSGVVYQNRHRGTRNKETGVYFLNEKKEKIPLKQKCTLTKWREVWCLTKSSK